MTFLTVSTLLGQLTREEMALLKFLFGCIFFFKQFIVISFDLLTHDFNKFSVIFFFQRENTLLLALCFIYLFFYFSVKKENLLFVDIVNV